jgi:hypothetical protein
MPWRHLHLAEAVQLVPHSPNAAPEFGIVAITAAGGSFDHDN